MDSEKIDEQVEKPEKPVTLMRRFVLMRDSDPSGMSGVGVIAEGCQWTDGSVYMKWLKTDFKTETRFENIASVENLHSHAGAEPTYVVWVDKRPGSNGQKEEDNE